MPHATVKTDFWQITSDTIVKIGGSEVLWPRATREGTDPDNCLPRASSRYRAAGRSAPERVLGGHRDTDRALRPPIRNL